MYNGNVCDEINGCFKKICFVIFVYRYELMQSCWQANADERPPFVDIRQQFGQILERNVAHYGYIPLIVGNIDDSEEICEESITNANCN